MLNKTGAIETISAGKKAISEVKGLKFIFFRGIILNYIIFLFIILILNTFFYFIIVEPIIDWVFGFGNEFWVSLVTIFKWTIQISLSAIIALISLRFSIEFLSFWNHCLVNSIIRNFRQIKEKKLSFKNFVKNIKYFFVESFKSCFYPILLMIISFIPFIGIPIIFFLECHYLGNQCILVYLENLDNHDEVDFLKKKWRFLPMRIGWLPTILSFIPFLGWALLPLTITFQVIGFAYLAEKFKNS